MSYYVRYSDDEGRELILSEETTCAAAIVSALVYAQEYAGGEFCVIDGGGATTFFQCYPDGDNITVLSGFVVG